MAKEDKFWLNFFKNAGLQKSVSAEYAAKFVQNRMQSSLVQDLTEDILRKLDIKMMGDIINILKYAKYVNSHESKPVLRLGNIAGDEATKDDYKSGFTNVEYLTETDEEEEEVQRPSKKVIVKQPKTQQTKTQGKKRSSSGGVFNRLGDNASDDDVIIISDEPSPPASNQRKKIKKSSTGNVFSRLAADGLHKSGSDSENDVRLEHSELFPKRKKIKKPVEINVTFKNAKKPLTSRPLRIRGIPKNKISMATEEVYTSLHSDVISNNQVKKRIGNQPSKPVAMNRKEVKNSVGVFSRLGKNNTTVTSQTAPKSLASKKVGGRANMDRVESSAFSRLGGATKRIDSIKGPSIRSRIDSEDSALQYQGVLKSKKFAPKKTTGVFARLGK